MDRGLNAFARRTVSRHSATDESDRYKARSCFGLRSRMPSLYGLGALRVLGEMPRKDRVPGGSASLSTRTIPPTPGPFAWVAVVILPTCILTLNDKGSCQVDTSKSSDHSVGKPHVSADEVHTRLAMLEGRCSRSSRLIVASWAIAGLGVLLSLGLCFVAARQSLENQRLSRRLAAIDVRISPVLLGRFDRLSASSIDVISPGGTSPVIQLTRSENGDGMIVTRTIQGQSLTTIGATDNGEGFLSVGNGKGVDLVVLSSTTDGGGAIQTFSKAHVPLVQLMSTDVGGGGLIVHNSNGAATAMLLSGKNTASLDVVTSGGNPIVSLGGSESGAGYNYIYNSAGQRTAGISVAPNGSGFIFTTDATSRPMVQLGMSLGNTGAFNALDQNGNVLVEVGCLLDGSGVVGVHDPTKQNSSRQLKVAP